VESGFSLGTCTRSATNHVTISFTFRSGFGTEVPSIGTDSLGVQYAGLLVDIRGAPTQGVRAGAVRGSWNRGVEVTRERCGVLADLRCLNAADAVGDAAALDGVITGSFGGPGETAQVGPGSGSLRDLAAQRCGSNEAGGDGKSEGDGKTHVC